MAEITSDNYAPIAADGNYDVINLQPGVTYGIKFWGTWQTTNIDLQFGMPDGTFVSLDDDTTVDIDGTVSEFTVLMPWKILRLRAQGTTTAPSIKYTVFPKKG